MHGTHATNAYRKVGLETGVIAASPHQLIMMLFDGARAAIAHAQRYMQQGDIAAKGMAITKAIGIIGGLKSGLNMDVGGELPQRLAELYDLMNQRLLMANLHNDADMLREVDRLLDTLGSAWREIGPQAASAEASGTSAATSSIGAGA